MGGDLCPKLMKSLEVVLGGGVVGVGVGGGGILHNLRSRGGRCFTI